MRDSLKDTLIFWLAVFTLLVVPQIIECSF